MSKAKEKKKSDLAKEKAKKKSELSIHRLFSGLLYAAALYLSYYIVGLSYTDANSSLVLIISTGAILATFGSALSAIGGAGERDLLDPDGHLKIPHLWPGQNPPPRWSAEQV